MTAKRSGARVTIPQVAEKAGVSSATAARALGGYGSVSRATHELVSEVAAAMGYRANGLARSMVTGSTHTIGVVLADIENTFFHHALRGIADHARSRGFEMLLVNTDEDLELERKALDVLVERRVDGLIVCPADAADRTHLTTLIDDGTPVVLLDRRIRGLRADTVGIDNRAAAADLTRRLVSRGHDRIAILTGGSPDMITSFEMAGLRGVEQLTATTVGTRAAGYRDALAEAGITLKPEYLWANGFRKQDALAATNALLDLPRPPTAIIAFDSIQALGALQGFRDRGVRCPDDISLASFDDAEWADVVSPALSVVAQPAYDIGATSSAMLLQRIGGDQRRVRHRELRTTFIGRDSVGPPPRR